MDVTTTEQAEGLRRAAEIVAESSHGSRMLHRDDGALLATIGPELGRPLAAMLLVAATTVERQGNAEGCRNALEFSSLLVGRDLGYRA